MASNHTANVGLSLWEPGDAFVRADFNADHEKVDAALRGLETGKAERADLTALAGAVEKKAEQTDLSALRQTVGEKGRMACGTYTGDGTESQYISVGFPVKAVLVENQSGSRNSSHNAGSQGGLAVAGGPLTNGITLVKVSGSGFYVYKGGEYQGNFNNPNGTYYYVAWG